MIQNTFAEIRHHITVVALALSLGFALVFSLGTAHAQQAGGERIIVSGASGQVGSLVVEALLAREVPPANLILVSRSPDEQAEYARMGASTRFGDFTQPESLASAYEGGDRLLLISIGGTSGPQTRTELHETAINAAIAAGVQHVVYISFVDADRNTSPIAADHKVTEAILRDSGVTWTALRDQWYIDRIVAQAATMIENGRVLVDPDEVGAAYITRQDVAAAAAAVLTTAGHENRVYELTGPELIKTRDIAQIASDISGVAIEIVEATPAQRDELTAPLPSSETLSTHVEDLTGQRGTTARQFLEANREALLAARPSR